MSYFVYIVLPFVDISLIFFAPGFSMFISSSFIVIFLSFCIAFSFLFLHYLLLF